MDGGGAASLSLSLLFLSGVEAGDLTNPTLRGSFTY